MKIYATLDFVDEMLAGVWTPERMKKYFTMLRDFGISRLYWIDQREIMLFLGLPEKDELLKKSRQNFNDKITETAIQIAHETGLEIFALIKPYEHGVPSRYYTLESQPDGMPVLKTVSGRCGHATKHAAEHPEVMLRRVQAPEHGTAENLTLYLASPLPRDTEVKLYGSAVNGKYQVKTTKIAPAGSSEVTFKLPENDRFFALQIEDTACGNQYKNIVRITDHAGCDVPLSLAIQPLFMYQSSTYHLEHKDLSDKHFSELGMNFDYFPGIPSGLYNSDLPPCCYFDFSTAQDNVLGVSLELNDRIVGFPDPENTQFHEFVLDWISKDIEMGFDGVGIRISSHNSPLFWSDYGTGPAVRAARGEAHTKLLRRISQKVRQAGKIMGMHIEDFMYNCDPQYASPMEVFWDYQRWIDEKLMDEVSAKYIVTDGFTNENFAMIRKCKASGIAVNVCPFIHVVDAPLNYASWSLNAGADAFNIYEAATVWQLEADGDGFYEINPEKTAMIKRIAEIN